MKNLTLEGLLTENPAVAEQRDTIRDTLRALKELREAGFGGDGYTLAPPYGGTYVTRKRGLRGRWVSHETDT